MVLTWSEKMGYWGTKPWENDAACDWFDSLFKQTNLDSVVRKTLDLDIEEGQAEICAAAYLLVHLGIGYIWPPESLNTCLQVAIGKLTQILDLPAPDEHHIQFRLEAITPLLEVLQLRLNDLSGDTRK
jgi:hypothetical protein